MKQILTALLVILALSILSVSASGEWRTLANAPTYFGSYVPLTVLNDSIYAIRGANLQDFWRYDIQSDTWTVLAPLPFRPNYFGGACLVATDRYIYATRGGPSYPGNFWRYDPSTNSWTSKRDIPMNWGCCVQWGTSMVWTGEDLIFLHSSYHGLVQYRISTDSWSKLASSAFNWSWTGSTLIWTGEDYLYLNQGDSGPGFARYSFSTESWTIMTPPPTVICGGMVYTGGNYIYARTGVYDTSDFCRYSISEDIWEVVNQAPLLISAPDFDLVFLKGCIYTADGRDSARFWSFCISTISGLYQIIESLSDDVLSNEIKNSLLSKIRNAQKSMDKGAHNAAIYKLSAFIKEVSAQRGEKISEDVADMLIEYAMNILNWMKAG